MGALYSNLTEYLPGFQWLYFCSAWPVPDVEYVSTSQKETYAEQHTTLYMVRFPQEPVNFGNICTDEILAFFCYLFRFFGKGLIIKTSNSQEIMILQMKE